MKLNELAKDPITQLAAGISGIAALLNPEILFAVFDVLLASGPQIFSAVSVSALTLPQVIPPESATDWIVVAAAGLFLAYLGNQVYQNLERAT